MPSTEDIPDDDIEKLLKIAEGTDHHTEKPQFDREMEEEDEEETSVKREDEHIEGKQLLAQKSFCGLEAPVCEIFRITSHLCKRLAARSANQNFPDTENSLNIAPWVIIVRQTCKEGHNRGERILESSP